MKLVNLVPLKEGGAFGMTAKELAATYSLKRLQSIRDEIMGDMEQEAEPEGGRIADMYEDQLQGVDDAIAIKRGNSDTPLTYDQAIGRVSKDQFIKSKKFDRGGNRINEATEKSWSAVDVSRKAEKEISNKEWNERTTKKLDMLKKLNDAGKFKKDWDEEKLQGWVDQNYSWEKLSRQFKLNEIYLEMYTEQDRKADHSSFEFDNYNNDGDIPLPTAGWWEDGTKMTEDELEAYYDKMGDSTMHSIMSNNIGEAKDKYGRTQDDRDWEKGSKAGPGNPAYDAAREKAKQDTRFTIDGKPVDTSSIEMDGMQPDQGPDDGSVDAYIEYATFIDGTELSDDQMERFQDEHPDLTHEKAVEQMYQQEGFELEPEDMDNPDEDLVIIGSGYLDIKSNFGERPSQTNGEYAELGQKVVDQLHNGDKDAALDYIFSQINEGKVCESCGQIHEGSCGYTHKTDGSKLRTPGGTKGMDANKRTMGMMREVIKKEIKRFHENK